MCSDHFFDSDFTEKSLQKVISATPGKRGKRGKRVHLLLKEGSVPNTDPQDGSFRDPRVPLRSKRVVREPIIAAEHQSSSPCPSDLLENQ